jgi:hypothetical protein
MFFFNFNCYFKVFTYIFNSIVTKLNSVGKVVGYINIIMENLTEM